MQIVTLIAGMAYFSVHIVQDAESRYGSRHPSRDGENIDQPGLHWQHADT